MKWLGISFSLLLCTSVSFSGIYYSTPPVISPKQSLFLPNEKCPFQIQDGTALPLEFGTRNNGEFPTRFSLLANLVDTKKKLADNPDRQAMLDRIQQFKSNTAKKSPQDIASHAADLMHTGQPDLAINELQPLSRGRSASFAVLMNLAHAYATKGDYETALRNHEVAIDYEAKDDLKTTSPEQLKWLLMVEKKYYRSWLSWKLKNPKARPETDGPTPLFGPMKWTNESDEYQPGQLNAAEKAKLPRDAIAITQQMLLWNPSETGLYWLLAELYAADGQLRQAMKILDQCADSRSYSNHKVMMAHREILKQVVDKLPPERTTDEQAMIDLPTPNKPDEDNGLPPLKTILIGLGIAVPVVLVLLFLQIRSILARRRR